ncbi:MAG TPA: hypothetical protein VGB85_33990 [Nannocystis sp.]
MSSKPATADQFDDHGSALADVAALVALFSDPAVAALRASEARAAGFGARVWVRPAPAHAMPALAGVIRGADFIDLSPATLADPPQPAVSDATGASRPVPPNMSLATAPADPAWPAPATLSPGDRLVLRVEHDQLAAYCAWLVRAAAGPTNWTLTPFCPQPGGLFRLHLIAAARLALPPQVRVEVRHDLHGVRLAQVALGFGADTLAGPIDAGRHLPLAGVPRPSETSAAALCELVRQAGLEATTF